MISMSFSFMSPHISSIPSLLSQLSEEALREKVNKKHTKLFNTYQLLWKKIKHDCLYILSSIATNSGI